MLPAQVYKAVRRSIFSNFAEFVLGVFELEDFERVCNMDNRYESYPAFVLKLQQAESGSGPLVAIAEGRMDVADFSDLRVSCLSPSLYQGRFLGFSPLAWHVQ